MKRTTPVLTALALGIAIPGAGSNLSPPSEPGSDNTSSQGRQQLVAGEYTRQITVAGRERNYLLHIPSGLDRVKPVPVILAFHGGGSKPQAFAALTRLSERSGALGFVVAYPTGYRRFWNAGNCCGPPLNQGVDDVAFVRAVLDDLASVVNVDLQRVFATGFSNGGMMTYRLACELSDRIAAIAVNACSLGVPTCNPTYPVPVLAFHGTDDTFSPYHGGRGTAMGFRMVQMGAPETIRRWAQWNGCTGKSEVTYKKGAATCISYADCRQAATVTLCTIKGMGHQWPGHSFEISPEGARKLGLPEAFSRLGPGTNDLDATDMLLTFFQRHPMPIDKKKNQPK